MANWIRLPPNDGFTKPISPASPLAMPQLAVQKVKGLICLYDTLHSQHFPDKLPRPSCSPLLWALGQNTFLICPNLSPKLAHLVETVSLESKGNRVTLGGARWRAAVLLPMQSCWAEKWSTSRDRWSKDLTGPYSELELASICPRCFSPTNLGH